MSGINDKVLSDAKRKVTEQVNGKLSVVVYRL